MSEGEKSQTQQKDTSAISCPADIQGQTITGVEVGEETSRICLSNWQHIVVPTDALYPAGGADEGESQPPRQDLPESVTYYSRLGEAICEDCGAGFGASQFEEAANHEC